jgi:hypothetical protein
MASNKLRGTDSDGIKSRLDSVLGSDTEESDLSGAESMMFKHVVYLKMNLVMTGVYKVEILLTRNLCPCLQSARNV